MWLELINGRLTPLANDLELAVKTEDKQSEQGKAIETAAVIEIF